MAGQHTARQTEWGMMVEKIFEVFLYAICIAANAYTWAALAKGYDRSRKSGLPRDSPRGHGASGISLPGRGMESSAPL